MRQVRNEKEMSVNLQICKFIIASPRVIDACTSSHDYRDDGQLTSFFKDSIACKTGMVGRTAGFPACFNCF